MPSRLVRGNSKEVARKAIMIIGPPGTGKTLFASTAPSPLFLDAENRAEHTGVDRLVPYQDSRGFQQLADDITKLKNSPYEDGYINYEGIQVATAILDTVDRIQEFTRQKNEAMLASNKQQFYGVLLDDMFHKIVWPFLSLPINVILVCHSQEYQIEKSEQEASPEKLYPEVGLELEGKIKTKLWNYFDYVFHVVQKQNGQRVIITSPRVFEGKYYLAKDKTYTFKGEVLPFLFDKDTGKPKSDTLTTIFSEMATYQELLEANKAARSEAREALLAHAILKAVMKDESDAEGGAQIKQEVMPKLNDLRDITEKNKAATIKKGKDLIDELAKHKPAKEETPEEEAPAPKKANDKKPAKK